MLQPYRPLATDGDRAEDKHMDEALRRQPLPKTLSELVYSGSNLVSLRGVLWMDCMLGIYVIHPLFRGVATTGDGSASNS